MKVKKLVKTKKQTHVTKEGTRVEYRYRRNSSGEWERVSRVEFDPSQEPPKRDLYRASEFKRIVACVEAAEQILVIGEPGSGKTFLANAVKEHLIAQGYQVSFTRSETPTACFHHIASDLGMDIHEDSGKKKLLERLKRDLRDWMIEHRSVLICDDVHRWPKSLRIWLEDLHTHGVPLLVMATHPPAADIFLRLPRLELRGMNHDAIREIMQAEAQVLGITLAQVDIAAMLQSCGGNPMLARRKVKEYFMGLEELAPDHQEWIDGTPLILAMLMILAIVRFIGLAFSSTTLYLLGGIVTVTVAVVRLLMFSLPRKTNRLGR